MKEVFRILMDTAMLFLTSNFHHQEKNCLVLDFLMSFFGKF